jgi:hypothetical protein
MTPEGSIPSAAGTAPPPAATPTPAPSSAPAPAPAPAAVEPAAPAESAVESSTGAQPSARSTTNEQAREKLHAARRAAEGTQPEGEPEGELALSEAPPVIAEPEVEPLAPQEEVVPAEEVVAAPAEGQEAADLEDISHVLTEAELEAKYPRQLSKKVKADIAAREARRGALEEVATVVGGEVGLEVAKAIMPILWADPPVDEVKQPAEAEAWWNEQVDTLFDYFVLPEHANAEKLFEKMSHRFVTNALYEDAPARDAAGQFIKGADGKPIPTGAVFASNLISEEWGKQPDGQTPYDLGFVDSALKKHQAWGLDNGIAGYDGDDEPIIDPDRKGKPISLDIVDKLVRGLQIGAVNMETLDAELEAHTAKSPAAKPTPEFLALQEENAKLKSEREADLTAKQAHEAEQTRKREAEVTLYKTQAKRDVSNAVMQDVMPLLTDSSWAPSKDDKPEVASRKKTLGRMIARDINAELMGDPESPNEDWAKAWGMVERYEAYDQNGKRTPRFKRALEPLQITAKAKFLEIKRELSPGFQFAALSSRDARLAKKNGSIRTEQSTVPPVATVQPSNEPKPGDPGYYDWRAEQARKKLRASREAAERAETVGVL